MTTKGGWGWGRGGGGGPESARGREKGGGGGGGGGEYKESNSWTVIYGQFLETECFYTN